MQQSHAARAVGALLAQVAQLSPPHQQLCWYAYETADHPACLDAAILHHLRRCCSAVRGCELPQLQPGEDPINSLMALVLKAVGLGGAGQSQHTTAAAAKAGTPRAEDGQHQHQQQQPDLDPSRPGQQQQEEAEEEGQQQWSDTGSHPAEGLRQLLDVLLSALQGRHAEWMFE